MSETFRTMQQVREHFWPEECREERERARIEAVGIAVFQAERLAERFARHFRAAMQRAGDVRDE